MKQSKLVKNVEKYLETMYFTNYAICPKAKLGTIERVGVHQLISINSIERDVDQAIEDYERDGFPKIYFYI